MSAPGYPEPPKPVAQMTRREELNWRIDAANAYMMARFGQIRYD